MMDPKLVERWRVEDEAERVREVERLADIDRRLQKIEACIEKLANDINRLQGEVLDMTDII